MNFDCCCFCKYAIIGKNFDELVDCTEKQCEVRYDDICENYINFNEKE